MSRSERKRSDSVEEGEEREGGGETDSVVGGSQRGHLVSIPCVLEEEQFDLLGDLARRKRRNQRCSRSGPPGVRDEEGKQRSHRTHLGRRKQSAPFLNELDEHAVGTTLLNLPQSAVDGELVVRHSHVGLIVRRKTENASVSCSKRRRSEEESRDDTDLISLNVVLSDRFEFSRWDGVEETGLKERDGSARVEGKSKRRKYEPVENRHIERCDSVGDEALEIGLRDPSDGVDVCTRTATTNEGTRRKR